MIFKPKNKIKDIKFGLFCGLCGEEVPFERKYLTEYCQQKLQKVARWNVYIAYVCPKCGNITRNVLLYNESQSKMIEKIDLYREYQKK